MLSISLIRKFIHDMLIEMFDHFFLNCSKLHSRDQVEKQPMDIMSVRIELIILFKIG